MEKMFTIDDKNVPYLVANAGDYYRKIEGYTPDMVDYMMDFCWKQTSLINQIIGLKISCYLLRHTTGMCESVPDCLRALKDDLIKQLKKKYDYDFKEAEMEELTRPEKSERGNV